MFYVIKRVGESDRGDVYSLFHPRIAFDIEFRRDNLQEVLRSYDLTPGEIGSVLRLLNKKYPVPVRCVSRREYSVAESIEALGVRGYRVFKRDDLFNTAAEIRRLVSLGYVVESESLSGYKSPCAITKN